MGLWLTGSPWEWARLQDGPKGGRVEAKGCHEDYVRILTGYLMGLAWDLQMLAHNQSVRSKAMMGVGRFLAAFGVQWRFLQECLIRFDHLWI